MCIFSSLSSRCSQTCLLYLFRIWQFCCRPNFPETDGAFGILAVLSAGRRLGLPHHHQHGTDEASVRQQNKPFQKTCHNVSLHWNFHRPLVFLKWTLWHFYLNCETTLAVCKVLKWPKASDTTNSWRLEQIKDILSTEKHDKNLHL